MSYGSRNSRSGGQNSAPPYPAQPYQGQQQAPLQRPPLQGQQSFGYGVPQQQQGYQGQAPVQRPPLQRQLSYDVPGQQQRYPRQQAPVQRPQLQSGRQPSYELPRQQSFGYGQQQGYQGPPPVQRPPLQSGRQPSYELPRQQAPVQRPPFQSGRQPSYELPRQQPPPQQGQEGYLEYIFQQVDLDRNGQITVSELQQALSNGRNTPFNLETVRLMISMFDDDHSGTIGFHEFTGLWKYLNDWQLTFYRFDEDHSGSIDNDQLKHTLMSFGYRFSDSFYDMLVRKFDHSNRGSIAFDDFIECCVVLEKLTNNFREHDTEKSGSINVTYEDFLTMVFSVRP